MIASLATRDTTKSAAESQRHRNQLVNPQLFPILYLRAPVFLRPICSLLMIR
jgi:hypothetical protein